MGIVYLPEFLLGSKILKQLYDNEIRETGIFRENINDLINQCFVDTATWGLQYWEEFLGLKIDESKSDINRREYIKAKIRGSETTTKERIKNVASAYSGGVVDVLEYPLENRFEVKFTGTVGIPPNMDSLTKSLDEIKPAHLLYSYIYIYIIYNQLKSNTHGMLATKTHFGIRNGL